MSMDFGQQTKPEIFDYWNDISNNISRYFHGNPRDF